MMGSHFSSKKREDITGCAGNGVCHGTPLVMAIFCRENDEWPWNSGFLSTPNQTHVWKLDTRDGTFGWLIDDGWSWHLKSSLAVRAVPVPRKKSLAIAAGVISQLMSTKFLFHRVYTPSIPVVPVKSPFPLDYIHFLVKSPIFHG